MKVLHSHAGDNRSWGGKSRELSPGLLATYGSRDITQEGMGIGSVALKTGGFTYFPSTCITEHRTPYNIIKTFSLDSRLTLHCGTFLSPFLSWVSEQIVAFYMRHPVLQKTILAGSHNLQRLLPLRFCRESFPSLAEARFAYIINGLFVTVTCNISLNGARIGKAYILNELGADYFTSSLHHETVARPPSGWEQTMPARDGFSLPLWRRGIHHPHTHDNKRGRLCYSGKNPDGIPEGDFLPGVGSRGSYDGEHRPCIVQDEGGHEGLRPPG